MTLTALVHGFRWQELPPASGSPKISGQLVGALAVPNAQSVSDPPVIEIGMMMSRSIN